MPTYKLKDLVTEVISGEWGEELTEGNEGTKIIRTTNFSNVGKLDLEKEVVSRLISSEKIDKKRLLIGDTIIEKSGGSPDQPVGRVVYFEEDDLYLCNNFTSVLRPNKELVVPKYLMYLLFNLHRTRKVMKFQNKTTGIINLKLDQYLSQTNVIVPSKEIQWKIVEVLDNVFNLITKRQSQITALDELTQSLFLEMFGDPKKETNKYKKVFITDLLYEIKGGGTPSKSKKEYYENANVPWVTPKDMKEMYIRSSKIAITEEAVENSSANYIPKNSLLMVIRSGILKRYLPLAINKVEVTLNQDMKALIPNKTLITVEYLYTFFNLYQSVLLNKVRSVTADNLDFNDIKKIKVPLPSIEEQLKFTSRFEEIQKIKLNLEKQKSNLDIFYNSLLHKAFKGELLQH